MGRSRVPRPAARIMAFMNEPSSNQSASEDGSYKGKI